MNTIYLFDWGNTLMVDFSDQVGKMRDWDRVASTPLAHKALKQLSEQHPIYIATNAVDSLPEDIEAAFARVELNTFITGYFCRHNLGVSKGSPSFYLKIAERLTVSPSRLTMVGDSVDNDIKPALDAGLNTVWFNASGSENTLNKKVKVIHSLSELCN